MKNPSQILHIIAGLLWLTGAAHASLILSEGESFTWSFESEDFSFDSAWTEPAHHLYNAWEVDIDNISADEIYSISFYENNSSEVPFSSQTYTNSGSSGNMTAALRFTSDIKWTDLQGVIKVEAIRGSVGIMYAEAHTIVNDEYLTASIPEPSSIALILVGVGAIFIRRNRFSNQSSEPIL